VPWLIFTGDFVFVGDVGRPDLLGREAQTVLAHQLYESVFQKLPGLPDFTEIFPGHGAGSLCGKAIGSRASSTLGYERRFNPALVAKSEEQWVGDLLAGMPIAPPYFQRMKQVNVSGSPILGPQLPGQQRVSAKSVHDRVCEKCLIVDVRTMEAFSAAHIPGAINIPFGPNLPTWAGWVLPYDRPTLIVPGHPDQVPEVSRHLTRVGFDSIHGWLDGGMEAWEMGGFPVETVHTIPAHELANELKAGSRQTVVDVRTEKEWNAGHIDGAIHVHGGTLQDRFAEIPRDVPVSVICGSGYRATIAASFLQREGFRDVRNVIGAHVGVVARKTSCGARLKHSLNFVNR
jgi:hydroxyacylglutathione hydrolase